MESARLLNQQAAARRRPLRTGQNKNGSRFYGSELFSAVKREVGSLRSDDEERHGLDGRVGGNFGGKSSELFRDRKWEDGFGWGRGEGLMSLNGIAKKGRESERGTEKNFVFGGQGTE